MRFVFLLVLLASTGCGSCAKKDSVEGEEPKTTQEGVNPANTKVRSHPPQIGHHPRGHIRDQDAEVSTPVGDH